MKGDSQSQQRISIPLLLWETTTLKKRENPEAVKQNITEFNLSAIKMFEITCAVPGRIPTFCLMPTTMLVAISVSGLLLAILCLPAGCLQNLIPTRVTVSGVECSFFVWC